MRTLLLDEVRVLSYLMIMIIIIILINRKKERKKKITGYCTLKFKLCLIAQKYQLKKLWIFLF